MGLPKVLTSKQIKFAQLIVYGVDGIPITKTEAAKLAGYSEDAREFSKLTNPKYYPLVCAYIQRLREEVREKYDITFDNHITELGKIRDQGKKDGRNLAAAATTEIARGKAAGFYIDQKLIRHGKIEDMNLNELYDKMKTIKERNERILDAQQLLERGNAKQKEEKQKEKSQEKKEKKSEEEKETLDV
jgi:phage terminase small subunit